MNVKAYSYLSQKIRCENIIHSAKIDFTRALNTLKQSLEGSYLVGNSFSIADIFIAQTLFWAKEVKEIETDLSFFDQYIQNLKEREGFPNIKDYLPK